MSNVNSQVVRLTHCFVTPHLGEELTMRQHLTGVCYQQPQQGILNGSEFGFRAILQHESLGEVHFEIA